jgi:hypothetical protein
VTRARLAFAVLVATTGAAVAVSLVVAEPRPAQLTQSRAPITTHAYSVAATLSSASVRPAAAVTPNGSWTEYHHDDGRTGWDAAQPPASGATNGWTSLTLNGSVYGEPLVYQGIVYVGTSNNGVYALNQSDGSLIWSRYLGAPQTGGWQCGNVNPTGILGTGVVDTVHSRYYVVAFLHSSLAYWLYGLDLATGAIIQSTEIAPAGFDWTIQQERGALAMSTDGTHVYIPFGGRAGDCGSYHGWVVGVPTSGAAPDELYETPWTASGIWAAGGVVVDDATGNVFFSTGNAIPCSGAINSDSVIRTNASLGSPTFFQPLDWSAHWCGPDLDLGSATPVLLSPSLLFTSGKYGQGFLLNPSNLGGLNGQLYPAPSPYTGADVCEGIHSDATFGSFAYAAPRVYLECDGGGLVGLNVNPAGPSFTPCGSTCPSPSWATGGSMTFGPPIVAGGVVWAVDIGGSGLYGFDAATGVQIFQSYGFGVTHFSTPSEAGGQIFASANNVVRSFNLLFGCSTMNASAAPPSTANVGSTVAITGTASGAGAGCSNPQYEFWMLPPGGAWTVVQPYSSNPTFTWHTTGQGAGAYLFSVWARNAGGTRSYEAFSTVSYTLTISACSGVSVSSSPPSTTTLGMPVTISGSATGCPNPLFEVWMKSPSGGWSLAQAYSSSPTFNWSTTGLPAGSYLFSVWARDASSPAAYDAFGTALYTLTTCSAMNAAVAPPTSANVGVPVTVTGSATGCPNPLYEFWLKSPSGSWTVAQAYSSSPTFNWSTTGKPSGAYLISVWARDASSPGTFGTAPFSYDTFGTASYSLTVAPCTGMGASAAPATTATAGTTVIVTGAATGCPNPQYEFWIKYPNGTWTLARGYSSSQTLTWSTTGKPAGSYLISVWARDASSAAAYDSFSAFPYTLT